MSHAAEPATFTFRSHGLEVEFQGHEEFVSAQIEHLHPSLVRELADRDRRLAQEARNRVTVEPKTAPQVADVADAPLSQPVAVADADADTSSAPAAAAPALEEFYRRARTRHGRGALQEMILIFAYFLREYREKAEVTTENLNACFALVGRAPPRSLANTLGIMKRDKGYFHSGSQRGTYVLTELGAAHVRQRMGG